VQPAEEVADEIGTTTRAVYSTFGSKDGLLAALAMRSFAMLRDDLARLPHTEDPARDLVQAALTVFRPMAVEHPSLFRIAFLRAAPDVDLGPDVGDAARAGYGLLTDRVRRLADADLLGGRDVQTATREFNAMCFGMAVTELMIPTQLGADPCGPGARRSRRSSTAFAHRSHIGRRRARRTRRARFEA